MSSNNLQVANIFTRLIEVEEKLRLKRKEIATKTGYSPSMVSAMMNGGREPSERFIQLFCSAFHISEDWLRTGSGTMRTPITGDGSAELGLDAGSSNHADHVREAALVYFSKLNLNPAVADQVLKGLAKLDEGHQLIEAGKIVNDVAEILRDIDSKKKGQE